MRIIVTVLALVFAYLCGYTASATENLKTQIITCTRADGRNLDPQSFDLSKGLWGFGVTFTVGGAPVNVQMVRHDVRHFSGFNSEYRVTLSRAEDGSVFLVTEDLTGQNRTVQDPVLFDCP